LKKNFVKFRQLEEAAVVKKMPREKKFVPSMELIKFVRKFEFKKK